MEIRDKLIDILIQAHQECEYNEQHRQFPCDGCQYEKLDRSIRGCIFDKYADAIIESGLIKDDKEYEVVEQEITIPQVACPNCGYFVGPSFDIISYSYCPGCGVKLKRNRRNHNA